MIKTNQWVGWARSQRWPDGGEAGGAGSESQAARWWRVGNIVGPGRTQAAQQREARGGIDGSTGQELALHGPLRHGSHLPGRRVPRSEERRVGKEGRRRWSRAEGRKRRTDR